MGQKVRVTDETGASDSSRPSIGLSSDNSRSTKSVFVREAQRLGKYQILAELGRGGAANVSLAVTRSKENVRKLVVLKALLPELADEVGAVDAFLDEARLAAQLNHPNVVQTYEVGTESERPVIVMEYLEGQSFSRISRTAGRADQDLPLPLQLHVIIEMLQGLHYAHEVKSYDGRPLKLVHRDVSPQNVFVTYDGQVKILDFGIAKAASSSTHTAAGIMKGKIAYMAPEQMAGTLIDRRADIYSAGCMLWAAATGRKLWGDSTDVQIVRAVVAGRIPSPKSVNPSCPDELERIVMRALQSDPEKRQATALELQTEIEQFCEHQGFFVKQRDLARLVSELFAAPRAEFNESLERQLSMLLASESLINTRDTLVDTTSPSAQFALHAGTAVSASHATVVAGAAGAETATPKSSRSRYAVVAALLVLACVGLYTLARPGPSGRALQTPGSAAPPAEPQETASHPPVTPPSQGVVTFSVSPDGAQAHIMLDGALLPNGTTTARLPISSTPHAYVVQAEGFEAARGQFVVGGDSTVAIVLSAATPSSTKASPTRRGAQRGPAGRTADAAAQSASAAVPATPSAPTAAAQAGSCDNPFFVDAQGIKRVRPNCR